MNRFVLGLVAALAQLTGPAPAQTPEPIPLTIMASPLDINGPVFYAQDLGIFKKYGLDVHIQMTFAGVEQASTAILAGTADIGSANTATLAQAHLRGIDFRYFAAGAIFTEQARPTEVVAVLKSSPIHSAADLNGKTLSPGQLRSMLQCATIGWADKHGGDGKSLKFVEIPFPQMDVALQQHRVDAVVLTEPFASAATDTRVIGSAEEGVAPTFMVLGWYATATWLNAHTDAARRFIAAVHEASVWGNAHHKESAAIMSRYSKMNESTVDQMARAVYGLDLDPKLIQPPIDVAAHYGFIDHSFIAEDVIWTPPPKR
jgi:NitT/TauT family transport system substrate-binding protein